MNELYRFKEIQSSLDMWMEDKLFLSLFEENTEVEFKKVAHISKTTEETVVIEEQNSLRKMIKKPVTNKRCNGKMRVPSFY